MKRKDSPPLPDEVVRPTTKELWHLRCLFRLTKHLQRPPTLNELSDYCQKSVYPIWKSLDALVRKGILERAEADERVPGKANKGNPTRFVIRSSALQLELAQLDAEEGA